MGWERISQANADSGIVHTKKDVNFGAEPNIYFSTTINPALLPDTDIPACFIKQQYQGKAKVIYPDQYVSI